IWHLYHLVIIDTYSFVIQLEGYTEEIVHDFKQRLETMFERIGSDMGLDVADTLCFQLGGARRSMTRRQFILDLGLHTVEEMAKDGYWLGSERVIPDKGALSDYWVEISSGRDFLRGAPSYTYIRDLVRRLCYRHAEGRKSSARLSGGHFIGRLAHHFGLVTDDGLRGLSVVTRKIPLIDMERQQVAMAGSPEAAEDAPAVDKGAQADPAPMQAPHPPPPPPAAGLVERSMIDQDRFSTWMISCMTQLMEASGRTYQAFDGTFRGSYPVVFERRTRRRTDGASTSTAP
ncbi:hypothetical protein Tco_0904094, partial [Tanacetum coccineum]